MKYKRIIKTEKDLYAMKNKSLRERLEIRKIQIHNENLTEIFEDITDFPNLLEINVSKNNIKSPHLIPYKLKHLDKLKQLNLNKNPIEELSPILCADLKKNNVKIIPKRLCK